MPKEIDRLSDAKARKNLKPGWYCDGRGLYLQVSKWESKSWVFRYKFAGRERRMGLGAYHDISLSEARELARECRNQLKQGFDPIELRLDRKRSQEIERLKDKTFKECATAYIESRKPEWTNAKHSWQWTRSLEQYAYPVLGDLLVQQIDLNLVLEVLEPIWTVKTETATRVRQRIEAVLDWSTVRDYREGPNPARLKGHLDKVLPERSKIARVVHQAAMDYRDLPEFYRSLCQQSSISALALRFIILTVSRSNETRSSRIGEIDENTWIVPEERTKSKREHRVPLSKEALKVLDLASPFLRGGYIFSGTGRSKGISDTAVRNILKSSYPELTVHGFRSTFRDWVAEQTSYQPELAEKALGHVLRDKVEAAYQRGDLFEKRRCLMDSWANYCMKGKARGDVSPIKSEAG